MTIRCGLSIMVCASVLTAASGCAAHRVGSLRAHLVKPGEPSLSIDVPGMSASANLTEQQREELRAHVPKPSAVQTVEAGDKRLTAALRNASVQPSAGNYRAVAAAYRRLGILDLAYDYLTKAASREPKSSQVFEERAQIWREWNLPQVGLADAHRAVYLDSRSASAHSTLGTLLQAVGDLRSARVEFDKAVALDRRAAYALNNLCYLSFLEGKQAQAEVECGKALALLPGFDAARNNLALSYAAAGDFDRASAEFIRAGDTASAAFNLGMIFMTTGEYGRAVEAFRAATSARPAFREAIRQARRAAALAERQGYANEQLSSH